MQPEGAEQFCTKFLRGFSCSMRKTRPYAEKVDVFAAGVVLRLVSGITGLLLQLLSCSVFITRTGRSAQQQLTARSVIAVASAAAADTSASSYQNLDAFQLSIAPARPLLFQKPRYYCLSAVLPFADSNVERVLAAIP